MLKDKSIFSKWILDQSSFDSLEHIKQISDDILLLDLFMRKLRLLISSLRLSTLESVEFNFVQIFYLFLFRWFKERVASSRTFLHIIHLFHFLFSLYFHLLLLLRSQIPFCISCSTEICKLIWLDHWAHKGLIKVILIEIRSWTFVWHILFTKSRSF